MNASPMPLRSRLAIFAGRTLDRAHGRDGDTDLPRLEEMAKWGSEALGTYQDERIAVLLRHCWEHIPFYRRRLEVAGLEAADLERGREVLRRLPPLTKDELRDHGNELKALPDTAMQVCSTSGSTGRPVTVWQDRGLSGWGRAVQRRAFRWYGVDLYEPRAMLLSAPLSAGKRLRHRLVDLAIGRRLFAFHDLGDEHLEKVVRALRAYRPVYITAYPGVLHSLCHFCLQQGISLADLGIRLLHCQSEMLLDLHRESFRRVFGDVPVMDEYGCVEVGAMAYTCPRGTRHISHEHVFLETVGEDRVPSPPGESGRILLTPLEARGMPLLRYEIGDDGAVAPAHCPCGRGAGAEALVRLDGRSFDRIWSADGRAFNAGIVHFLIKKADAVGDLQEYLAVQPAAGQLHFLVIPTSSANGELTDRLRGAGREVFGAGIEISVETTDAIERPPGRKRSYFLSRLPSEEAIP